MTNCIPASWTLEKINCVTGSTEETYTETGNTAKSVETVLLHQLNDLILTGDIQEAIYDGTFDIVLRDTLTMSPLLSNIEFSELEDAINLIVDQGYFINGELFYSLTDVLIARYELTGLTIPWSYYFLLLDSITAVDTEESTDPCACLFDYIIALDSQQYGPIHMLTETILANSSMLLKEWFTTREDTITVLDVLVFGWFESLNDTIAASDSTELTYHLVDMINVLASIHNINGMTLSDTIEAIDTIFNILSDTLNDTVNAGIIGVLSLCRTFLDTATLSDSYVFIYPEHFNETLTLTETLTPYQLYIMLLNDKVECTIVGYEHGSFVAYVVNPRAKAVSTYDNWTFNSYARSNNRTYACNNDGVYEITGHMDESDYITSQIKTSQMSFGTSDMKYMEQAYISLTNDNQIILSSEDEYGTKAVYTLDVREGLHLNRIKLGKGHISKYFTFTLEDVDSEDFELDSLELQPVQLARKLR